MKAKLLFLSIVSCVFIACNNNSQDPTNTTFKEGEEVTLTVAAPNFSGETTDYAAPGRTIFGREYNGKIYFYFVKGDKIIVKMGDKSSEFSIVNFEAGKTSLEFRGTMPDDGDEFDVIYEGSQNLALQNPPKDNIDNISVNIENGYMRFEAKNATLGKTISLLPVWPVIVVNAPITSTFDAGISVTDDTYRRSAISRVEIELTPKGESPKTYTYKATSGDLTAGSDRKADPVLHCYIVVNPMLEGTMKITTYWDGANFLGYEDLQRTVELELDNKSISPSVISRTFPIDVDDETYSLNIPNAFVVTLDPLSVNWKKKTITSPTAPVR